MKITIDNLTHLFNLKTHPRMAAPSPDSLQNIGEKYKKCARQSHFTLMS